MFFRTDTLKGKILLALSAAVLYALLNWLVSNLGLALPKDSAVSFRPQIAIPITVGLILGPFYGFVAGFLGNVLGDYMSGYGLAYWNWSLGNGFQGAIPPLLVYFSKTKTIRSVGQFGIMQVVIVIGTFSGLVIAALIEDLALQRPMFHDVYSNWVVPMAISNVLFALALVPLLLVAFKKIVITVETRTILMISLSLVVSIVVVAVVLIVYANNVLISLVPTADLKATTYSYVRWAGMASVFILLAGTMTSLFLVKRLTSPVSALGTAARTIGSGDLQTSMLDPITRRSDELGELARTLHSMVENLKKHIEELKKTTAAKERIESELRVATDIQMSMLPRVFPPFPDHKEFDIFASMEPAKEVGGDLYDFFFAGPDKLCFVIGDVCDKGVPAALFMAITKALLRTAGSAGLPPDAMLAQTNNILNPENDASMFATVFCATLDANTGELRFANAGHPPPLLDSNANGVQYMKLPKGFVVGPMPSVVYTCQSLMLTPGESLFLYTDGVTEAANGSNQFYTEARLQAALTKLKGKDATGMVKGVREDVAEFVGGSPQNDDITMLAIRFLGKPISS